MPGGQTGLLQHHLLSLKRGKNLLHGSNIAHRFEGRQRIEIIVHGACAEHRIVRDRDPFLEAAPGNADFHVDGVECQHAPDLFTGELDGIIRFPRQGSLRTHRTGNKQRGDQNGDGQRGAPEHGHSNPASTRMRTRVLDQGCAGISMESGRRLDIPAAAQKMNGMQKRF